MDGTSSKPGAACWAKSNFRAASGGIFYKTPIPIFYAAGDEYAGTGCGIAAPIKTG
jgi:hypothetical protein